MKPVRYIFIFSVIFSLFGCSKNHKGGERSTAEVEIIIGSGLTRSDAVSDKGHPDESIIAELDLLLFEQGKYQYRRKAYKVDNTNRFRANLLETQNEITCQIFANCTDLLDTWESGGDHQGKEWADIEVELMDTDPARLISSTAAVPLPMWGKTTGRVSTTGINTWGPVELLRSVASVDVYIEKNQYTALFELTDIYLWYGPNRGYLPPVIVTGGSGEKIYTSPPDMSTSFTTELHADGVQAMIIMRDYVSHDCDAIAFQIYCYDNDVMAESVTESKRFSRAIVCGYYNQDGDRSGWKKSYYPLDFVYGDGTFRPLVRNWKYEFLVNAVNGPSYESPEEAAKNYPIDINVELIDWNREGIGIGVWGKYYLSIDRRQAYLTREAGSKDEIGVSYRILDDMPGRNFTLEFNDDINGIQQQVPGGIQNDWFTVTLDHDSQAERATLGFESRQPYAAAHSRDTVRVKFRDLYFDIAIRQYNSEYGDWESGGNQTEELKFKLP